MNALPALPAGPNGVRVSLWEDIPRIILSGSRLCWTSSLTLVRFRLGLKVPLSNQEKVNNRDEFLQLLLDNFSREGKRSSVMGVGILRDFSLKKCILQVE